MAKGVTGWKFNLFLFSKLPMGWIAGLRVKELSGEHCVTSVPFKWLTKNPFRSMYFAVQAMAAELSTASACLLAVDGHQPSIAFIIVDMKARFFKKATSRVYFTCTNAGNAFEAVEKCVHGATAETATFTTTGKMKDGTIVSEFEFTWSFKQRSSQIRQ
ncbi:MAG: DUF4442 domain-containing protein [Cyclobacteriaceae bacterium]|nr:DUF4442 domain-containing protein [Cyclobacteriaceae bacterium]